MNQHLQNILNVIQQDENLSTEQKNAITKSLKDADKELEITSFKLDRTEKVKRTTAILLEETIEELENKRKAIEAQNRELEIESSLEKVRTVAMGMRKRDDMLDICRIILGQLELLGIKEIRNVQTAIFYEHKGTYINYEYYRLYDKALVTEVDYTNDEISIEFAAQMIKGADEVFIRSLEGQQVKDWLNVQKTTNVFIDTNLENAGSLTYYWFSLGPVAIGMSTYEPLSEEDITLFKRFRNVFDLAYRRYLDIEKAEAQAREAQIEVAMERIRARAMAMHSSAELREVANVLREQMALLDQPDLETSAVLIFDDALENWDSWYAFRPTNDTGGRIKNGTASFTKNSCELTREIVAMYRSSAADYTLEISGAKRDEWLEVLKKEAPEVAENAINTETVVFDTTYFHFSDFNGGSLLTVSYLPPSEEIKSLQRRAASVFDLAYRRFLDLKKAEAQARESQIEAALERVRSRSLAMHNTSELQEVIHVVHKELLNLNIAINGGSFIAINSDIETTLRCWGSGGTANTSEEVHLPLYEKPFCTNLINGIKNGPAFFTEEYTHKEKKEFFTFLFKYKPWSKLDAKQKKETLSSPGGYTRSCCVSQHTSIFIINHFGEKFTATDNDILQRFGKVFEQTYTRFLDLQKAEAQSRESQIELGLERVRARAMAMQHSDELKELIGTVYNELTKLDLAFDRCLIWVMNTEDLSSRLWMANAESQPVNFYIPHHDNPPYLAFVKAWKHRNKRWHYDLHGQVKKEWDGYVFNQTEMKHLPDPVKKNMQAIDRVMFAASFHNFGCLQTAGPEPLKEEQFDILNRFAKVFDLTYTRFNDLQKAEAQSREAQIELALERVRARTMAMQRSDELREAVLVIYEQLQQLNFESRACNIIIIDKESGSARYWVSGFSQEIFPESYTVPYLDHPYHDALLKPWKQGDKYVVYEYTGKMKQSFDEIFFTQTEFRNVPEEAKNVMIGLKSVMLSTAFFSYGALQALGAEPLSEENANILQRFAKVFEQTYTRFLDLQKAEAQAREAQIQLALERVRARTMAMQKSGDLNEAASDMFKQIQTLGMQPWACGFNIFDKDGKAVTQYMSVADGGISPPFRTPLSEDPFFINIYDARQRKEDLLVMESSGESLSQTYRYMFGLPGSREIFGDLENSGFEMPKFQITHCAYFSQGYLVFITYEQVPEAHDIFRRFAKVFEQTYTRFLDLQKAEAQAREAKIEAALERTRTQSMIMQHSKELDDTLRVFHEQVLLLGIKSEFSFLWLPDEERDRHIFWAAWAENNLKDFKSKAINYPLDRNEPATAQCIVDWKSDQPVVSYHVPPGGVESYFAAWQELIAGVEELKPENFSDGLYYVEAFMKYGCFGVMIKSDLSEDEKKILYRFTIEFERTYTRFLDLQKAEAQAREAQIEASLERVRSRTMAMQRSDELANVAQLLFQQVKDLGITAWTTGFNIWQEDNASYIDWITSPTGEFLEPYLIDATSHPVFAAVREARQRGDGFFVSFVEGKEIKEIYELLNSFGDKGQFQKMLDSGIQFPTHQYNHFVFGAQVSLLFITYEACPEEWDIYKRFGKVFEQTYTRFLDLQKAEAQAREAQIEAALERVRSRSMAMYKSGEVMDVAVTVYDELQKLDFKFGAATIIIMDKETGYMEHWLAGFIQKNHVENYPVNNIKHPLHAAQLAAWRKGEKFVSIELSGAALKAYAEECFTETGYRNLPDEEKSLLLSNENAVFNLAYMSHGALMWAPSALSDEKAIILQRFAKVFEQTYTRFLDLQKAEAQAREAQIEAALERVRSRTLAMQRSDELAETASVLFKQLILLGIEPNRLYINIIKDETAEAEFWITDEDGSKISMAYTANMNANPSFKKMFEGWKEQKRSLVIDMHGKELEEYFEHLGSLKVPFKGGLSQKRRLQYIAYFNKGFIGMASPDEQSEGTMQLLERFAAVFNLTFTRFNDLKIAEAHALQAEQDLIEIKAAKKKAEDTLTELQATQKQLVQSEKMASLGELTAGIAHEIQNPLNFVNNFSDVSNELLEEMKTELEKGNTKEVIAIVGDVKQNLEKILHHGKRADAIVKGMLQHSRTSSSQKELTDINTLADEYLRLAYHGLRAKDKSFNAAMKTDFDETIGKISIVPQDIGRAVLNLITNAFYVVAEKKKQLPEGYEPTVTVTTKKEGDKVFVSVKDNGGGIPQKVLDKIFQPFFTTKPTGQGTGLGLSLAYDIVKAHGGEIKVETKEGEGSTFIIQLSSNPAS